MLFKNLKERGEKMNFSKEDLQHADHAAWVAAAIAFAVTAAVIADCLLKHFVQGGL